MPLRDDSFQACLQACRTAGLSNLALATAIADQAAAEAFSFSALGGIAEAMP
ncbi:MAG: hypothetical protein WCF22_05565 [Candidatus Sulfotelmatobacter sp.]